MRSTRTCRSPGTWAFPSRCRAEARTEIRDRVTGVARTLGLEGLLERYPAQLSGGERQRVAVGRAIVRDPDAFLLDEPLSNLDAQLRADMRLELADLQRRLGATFIFVTHDQVEAMTLADTIAIMRSGELHQYAAPEEIYHRPADRFVAGFIGSPVMNFIEGRIGEEEGRSVLRTEEGELVLGTTGDVAVPRGRDVVLGIRPEHFIVSPEGGTELSVEIVETLGSQTFVYGSAGQRRRLAVGVDPSLRPAPGDRLRIALDPDTLHFFAPDSGRRIQDSS